MASLDEFLKFKAEIDALTSDLRKTEVLSAEQRASFDQRVEQILLKMEGFWREECGPAPDVAPEDAALLEKGDEPEMPTEVMVKQAGDAPPCGACGGTMPCVCFSHLPDPKITVEGSGLFKIEFPAEYNNYDRANFLAAMKLVIAKRKGKIDAV